VLGEHHHRVLRQLQLQFSHYPIKPQFDWLCQHSQGSFELESQMRFLRLSPLLHLI
jgi:hypothetical protein